MSGVPATRAEATSGLRSHTCSSLRGAHRCPLYVGKGSPLHSLGTKWGPEGSAEGLRVEHTTPSPVLHLQSLWDCLLTPQPWPGQSGRGGTPGPVHTATAAELLQGTGHDCRKAPWSPVSRHLCFLLSSPQGCGPQSTLLPTRAPRAGLLSTLVDSAPGDKQSTPRNI